MEVGLPIYFTQLEQVFNQYEAYLVETLLQQERSDSSPLAAKKESASDSTTVVAEPNQEAQGEPQNSSQMIEEDIASHGALVKEIKQSSETQCNDASSECTCTSRVVGTSVVEASATIRHSTDKIRSKLESFLEHRDVLAEAKLKELFAASQSSTAKENLLLSLRYRKKQHTL